jgi:hypothetical protein
LATALLAVLLHHRRMYCGISRPFAKARRTFHLRLLKASKYPITHMLRVSSPEL